MASSSKGKGAVKTLQFWKHLRWAKRPQNKRVRQDGKKQIREELKKKLNINIFVNVPNWFAKYGI